MSKKIKTFNVIGQGPIEAVDFDKTLAEHHGEFIPTKTGQPIMLMVQRVRDMLSLGKKVCIFSAALGQDKHGVRKKVMEDFSQKYFGQILPMANVKTPNMVRFWDDKAVHVSPNSGVVTLGSAVIDGESQFDGKYGDVDSLTSNEIYVIELMFDDHPAKFYQTWRGYPLAIENPRGSVRKWKDTKGNEGESIMQNHYGRIMEDKKGEPTKGADGAQLDFFLAESNSHGTTGKGTKREIPTKVYIVNQVKKDDPEKFDEHKIIIGAGNLEHAKDTYLQNYTKGWKCGSIAEMTPEEFDKWVVHGDHDKPAESIQTKGDSMRVCKACGKNVLSPEAILCENCGSSELITATHADPASDDAIIAAYDKNWPAEARHALKKEHGGKYFGDPDKEAFPISPSNGQEDLNNAARLVGHADNPSAVKSRLKGIGGSLGLMIPKSWRDDDNAVDTTATTAKVADPGLGNEDDPIVEGTTMARPFPDMEVSPALTNVLGKFPGIGTTDSIAVFDANELALLDVYSCSVDEVQLITDGLDSGVILKVRHVATIADSINGNKRLYPRKAIQYSVDGLRSKIRSGYRPYTEFRHPEAVTVGRDEHYVTHEDRKTGRIDDVEDPMPDGRVFITRSILDTPFGRIVAKAYRDGIHKGVSNRWKMSGYYKQLHGDNIHIAHDNGLDWHTTDDVENPAFPETRKGYRLLSDEMRAELQLPAATAVPAFTPKSQRNLKMNESFKKAVDEFYGVLSKVAISGRKAKEIAPELSVARRAMADELRLAQRAGEPINEMTGMMIKADEDASRAGFSIPGAESGRPGPVGYMANRTGTPSNLGYAPDMEASAEPVDGAPGLADPEKMVGDGKGKKNKSALAALAEDPDKMGAADEAKAAKAAKKKAKLDAMLTGLGLTPDHIESIKNQTDASVKAKADEVRKTAITAALDEADVEGKLFKGLEADEIKLIKDFVLAQAVDGEGAIRLAQAQKDSMMQIAAKHRLRGGGYDPGGSGHGQTVNDPGNPAFTAGGGGIGFGNRTPQYGNGNESRGPAYMSKVDTILQEHDNWAQTLGHRHNPNDSTVRSRRVYNRKHFIDPLLAKIDESRRASKSGSEWAANVDAVGDEGDKALSDAIASAAAVDSGTSLSNVFNQPVILTALIIEQFQDMQSLQFVQGIGPGLATGPKDPGWTWNGQFPDGRTGAVIRVPVETYSPPGSSSVVPGVSSTPATYGSVYGNQTDFGLLYPEGHGINPGTPNIVWLEFNAVFRRIAADITKDVMIEMGSGPLNYAAIARALFHITWDKSRRVDTANLNEMVLASDEYQMVLQSESPNLTYNSVYGAAGTLTVNLNPLKAANSTVSSTDPSVTYGSNVVGIVRVQSQAGTAVTASSATYCGTTHGTTPIVRPRFKTTLNAIGQLSNVVLHPVIITAPFASNYTAIANSLEGFVNPADGNIYNTPFQNDNLITALFAVDYENGLILFKTGATGLAGSSGVITSTVTYTYDYATNFTNFTVNNVQQLGLLATGQVVQNYYNGLFATFDAQAALMGSQPRFVKPDMAFMSLNASQYITQAEIFYKLQSPDGTSLFPTEDFFFQRTGILGARINAPWWGADRRIWLGRGGSTKYAINTPFEISGPYPKYDSNGLIIPGQIFYGEELSAQFTPQSVQQDGLTVVNPVSSTIILR